MAGWSLKQVITGDMRHDVMMRCMRNDEANMYDHCIMQV
jgi:hypothetical protein